MATTFLSADQIFDGEHWLANNSCLVITDGTIEDIVTKEHIDANNIQHYPGILCPGFVNAHCHLELSHLKDQFPQKTGLRHFLRNVVENRKQVDKAVIRANAEQALKAMHQSGIVAVGDIANTLLTLELKDQLDVYIHTFVECLGMSSALSNTAYQYALSTYQSFQNRNPHYHNASLAPHSPYAISKTLFQKIREGLVDLGAHVTTMHNQEWWAENDFYISKTGEVVTHLNHLGIDFSDFVSTGKNSLPSVAPWIEGPYQLILVHNTQTTVSDLNSLNNRSKVWLCLCPNANLYIEDTLPDVLTLANDHEQICIGTDSLASNTELSIWSEIRTLHAHFPTISLEKLLKWATYNGAKALNIDDQFGKIAKNKRPGIVHIPQPFALTNNVQLLLR